MSDVDQEINEYVGLPDDPEMAFAVLQHRMYAALRQIWESEERRDLYEERRYFDTLIAFDEVHDLEIFTAFRDPPNGRSDFHEFFESFCRHAEISSQKFKMEAARRIKSGAQEIVVLDANAREAIHALISAIKEKLNELTLPEEKRESLFNKLNSFAAEVDRNRTRTEAFLSFAIDVSRAVGTAKEELSPVSHPIDRILDLIEKASKLHEVLPPWKDRKRIEGPTKCLAPPQQDIDEKISL